MNTKKELSKEHKIKRDLFASILIICGAVAGVLLISFVIAKAITNVQPRQKNADTLVAVDATPNESDEILNEIIALSEEMSRTGLGADDYYEAHATIVNVTDASQTSNVLSEAEALRVLSARGFDQFPVTYTYDMNGKLF